MKKTIVVLLLTVAGVVLYVGPQNTWNGIRVANDSIRSFVGKSVSPEFQIKVMRKQLEDEKVAHRNSVRTKAVLATKLDNKRTEVAALAAKIKNDQKKIFALRDQLPGETKTRLVSTSSTKVASELSSRMTTFTSDKGRLATEEKFAAELENQLAILEKGIEDRRVKLELVGNELTKMETQLETLKLRNGGGSLPSQDSLRSLQSQLESVRDNIAVEERTQIELETMDKMNVGISPTSRYSSKTPEDAIEQFEALFGCKENVESM